MELFKLLLCKYELCKLLCEDEINGEVYKWDETADECDDAAVATEETDDCKSYFAGEFTLDECILDNGEVNGYEA